MERGKRGTAAAVAVVATETKPAEAVVTTQAAPPSAPKTAGRPRLFSIVWERGTKTVAFNAAATGAAALVVNASAFTEQVREELMIYGIRQIFPDSVAAEGGWDAKVAGMVALHKEMLSGEWRLGARVAVKRLVMESVFNAGRELGMLFPAASDEEARKKWAEATEYNRLRFAALPAVVAKLGQNQTAGTNVEDVFA